MKKTLIHRGIFVESLRRLRLAGILMTVIPLLLSVPSVLLHAYGSKWNACTFSEIYPILDALPFIAPPVLMAILFSAQTKRCDSDFYHSLPLTKRSLSVSWLTAVIVWLTVIVVGSSVVVFGLSLLHYTTEPLNVLLTVGGAWLAALMVTSTLFVAYAISGNNITALFVATIILFAPIVIVYMLSMPLSEFISVIPTVAGNFAQYQLLYGNEDRPITWLVTALITIVCLLIGYAAAGKRRSELAGQATNSRALQILLRTIFTYVFCLPGIYYLLYGDDLLWAILCYIIALTVYFLFELFTTKKAKNMLKAVPWLAVLLVLNIATVIGLNIASHVVCRFSPTPDRVNSVSIIKLEEYNSDNSKYYDYDEFAKSFDEDVDDDSADTWYWAEDFWHFQDIYDTYAAAEVEITDLELRTIACDALKRNLQYSTSDDYDILTQMRRQNRGEVFYRVTIAYHGDFQTRYRTVWLYSGEFVQLFDVVRTERNMPDYVNTSTVTVDVPLESY